MGKRHHSRRMALQVLYAREYLQTPAEEIARRLLDAGALPRSGWTPFCRDLVDRTLSDLESLDREIETALEHWRIERLSKVDHVLLRLALCEMRAFPDIPIRVTLNEYIELAKQFGTDDSSAFVNGILDRLSRQFPHKDFDQKDAPHSGSRDDAAPLKDFGAASAQSEESRGDSD